MTELVAHTRAIVYFEPSLHEAIRLKAIQNNRTVSDIVNDAVRQALGEDVLDLSAFEERAAEPTISYEALLSSLKSQ